MSNERISKKRVLILVLIVVALLVFATIWSETHKKRTGRTTGNIDNRTDTAGNF